MTAPCPACGAVRLLSVADHYAIEVRRPDADPEALAPLAPPLRVSILPGTACITLFFLSVLAPGFVPSGRELVVFLSFFVLGSASFLFWLRTRRTDRAAMAAYQKRQVCPDCNWHD